MKTAVVTGASGFVGRNLIRQLVSQNIAVYALVRNPEMASFELSENIHIIKCDLAEIGKLETILAGGKRRRTCRLCATNTECKVLLRRCYCCK